MGKSASAKVWIAVFMSKLGNDELGEEAKAPTKPPAKPPRTKTKKNAEVIIFTY